MVGCLVNPGILNNIEPEKETFGITGSNFYAAFSLGHPSLIRILGPSPLGIEMDDKMKSGVGTKAIRTTSEKITLYHRGRTNDHRT